MLLVCVNFLSVLIFTFFPTMHVGWWTMRENYSPSNQIMPHTCWGELGSRSLISNSYSAVFVSYNCSGFIVGRFDCSICTVPMRDPGLDRCSPSLLPPHPPYSCCLVIGRPTLDYPLTEAKHNWDPLARGIHPSLRAYIVSKEFYLSLFFATIKEQLSADKCLWWW